MLSDKEVGELWVESGRKAELPIVYELRLQMRHLIAKLVEERYLHYLSGYKLRRQECAEVQEACRDRVLAYFNIPPDEFRAWKEGR